MSGPPHGFGKGVNDYLNHYVSVADAKAGVTTGAGLAVAGLLLTHQSDGNLAALLNWLAVGLFIASALAGAFAIFPRRPSGGDGLIFWGDIATNATAADYHDAVEQLDLDEVEKAYATQNWHVSQVLHSKYGWTQKCIGLFLLGVAVTAFGIGVA